MKKWHPQYRSEEERKANPRIKNPELNKRTSNLFTDSMIRVYDPASLSFNSEDRTIGFLTWSKVKGLVEATFSSEVLFQGAPALCLELKDPDKQIVLFKQLSASSLAGRELEFSVFLQGRNTYYRGEVLFKIQDAEGSVIFRHIAWANAGLDDSWTMRTFSWTVPQEAKTLELSFRLQGISALVVAPIAPKMLYVASPVLRLKSEAARPLFEAKNKAPVNLQLDEPFYAQLPEQGWFKFLGSQIENNKFGNYGVALLNSRVRYLKQNSIELVSGSSDDGGFCGIQQSFLAADYRGCTIRFSGMLKLVKVATSSGSLIHLLSANRDTKSVNEATPSSGTLPWTPFCMQLAVPDDCDSISIGFQLQGTGHAFFSALDFQLM